MGRLANPAAPGASRFDRMIYASAGLNYGNIPALAAEYGIFDNPAAGFVTPRIDISAFAQLGNPLWPFDPTTVR